MTGASDLRLRLPTAYMSLLSLFSAPCPICSGCVWITATDCTSCGVWLAEAKLLSNEFSLGLVFNLYDDLLTAHFSPSSSLANSCINQAMRANLLSKARPDCSGVQSCTLAS